MWKSVGVLFPLHFFFLRHCVTPISLTEMRTGTSPGMYIEVPVLFWMFYPHFDKSDI